MIVSRFESGESWIVDHPNIFIFWSINFLLSNQQVFQGDEYFKKGTTDKVSIHYKMSTNLFWSNITNTIRLQ